MVVLIALVGLGGVAVAALVISADSAPELASPVRDKPAVSDPEPVRDATPATAAPVAPPPRPATFPATG